MIDDGKINAVEGEWNGRAFLLVDLDAFFASVEQLDHPEWRGKPVIVGGKANRRGVVSTCSYEARAFGVRSAMPSITAQRLCPDAIWASAHFDRYHEISAQVMEIMHDESPLLEQVSIDEAFLDVSPGRFCKEDPVAIASRIQSRVSALGVTCSVGVATCMSTAKVASDMDKPNGITVVYPGSEARFLAPMDVRALSGIGQRSASRLKELGIHTLGQLAQTQPDVLWPIFGINAEGVCLRAQGIDSREINTERGVKSVSHERTFAQDLVARDDIEAAIDLLGSLVGRRLRTKGLRGHTITLKLRYADLSFRTVQQAIQGRVDDETIFIPIAKRMLSEIWRPGDRVRLVGVGVSGFESHDEQMGLFTDNQTEGGSPSLLRAADSVRDRFGDGMLRFGRELKLKAEGTGSHGNNDGKLK